MSTMVSKFMTRATGPTRFSTKLRISTEPVHNFFSSLGALNGLKEEVPESVLGGDIFSLLSQSLQQMLLQPEPSEQEKYPVRPPKAGFSVGPDHFDVKETSKYLLKSSSPKESNFNFSPPLTSSESEKIPFSFTGSESRDGKKEPFNEPHTPEFSKSPSVLEPVGQHANRPSFAAGDSSNEVVKERKERVNSIFVEKLREYWMLSEQGQRVERESSQRTDVEKEKGGNALPHTLPNRPLASRSWPQMTGGKVAQKLGAFFSGDIDASKGVGQTFHPGASEKIEIQNTFHIEVKSEGDRTTDLSEKIADILREQALQHGIDIT